MAWDGGRDGARARRDVRRLPGPSPLRATRANRPDECLANACTASDEPPSVNRRRGTAIHVRPRGERPTAGNTEMLMMKKWLAAGVQASAGASELLVGCSGRAEPPRAGRMHKGNERHGPRRTGCGVQATATPQCGILPGSNAGAADS